MRRALQPIAAVLVFLMTPGLAELVDDAVHLLRTGHTEHAAAHDDHGDASGEHGCTGTFHTCPCHHSPTFAPAADLPDVVGSTAAVHPVAWREGRPADGVRFELLRPPIG